jgi:hypothetical protein
MNNNRGCATAQAVSRWLSIAAARILPQVRSCGICGGQSDTGASFPIVLRFPLPTLSPSVAPYSLTILSPTLYLYIQWVPTTASVRLSGRIVNLNTHLHLVSRSKTMELYLHSPITWYITDAIQSTYWHRRYITNFKKIIVIMFCRLQ